MLYFSFREFSHHKHKCPSRAVKERPAGLLKTVMVVTFNSHLSLFSKVGFYKIIYQKKAERQKYEIILSGC